MMFNYGHINKREKRKNKKTMNQKQLGDLGEKIAAGHLKKRGYKILDRNYPKEWQGVKRGEIDIIAKKGNLISFVEVKTLAESGPERAAVFFRPEDKVDFSKLKKIAATAQVWLNKNKIPLESCWQIDVISIRLNLISKKAGLRHFKNVSA